MIGHCVWFRSEDRISLFSLIMTASGRGSQGFNQQEHGIAVRVVSSWTETKQFDPRRWPYSEGRGALGERVGNWAGAREEPAWDAV